MTHVGLNDRDSRFDQAAREEQGLAKHVAAVSVAEPRVFSIELERAAHAVRGQDNKCAGLLFTERGARGAESIDRSCLVVDFLEQSAAIGHLIRRETRW
jgi:hypothetical protein